MVHLDKRHASYFPYIFGTFFLVALVDSWRRAEVNFQIFFEKEGRQHLWSFLTEMFPPDLSWDFLSFLFRPTLETIQISVMGTLIAVVIGFPVGSASNQHLCFSRRPQRRRDEGDQSTLHPEDLGLLPCSRPVEFISMHTRIRLGLHVCACRGPGAFSGGSRHWRGLRRNAR